MLNSDFAENIVPALYVDGRPMQESATHSTSQSQKWLPQASCQELVAVVVANRQNKQPARDSQGYLIK